MWQKYVLCNRNARRRSETGVRAFYFGWAAETPWRPSSQPIGRAQLAAKLVDRRYTATVLRPRDLARADGHGPLFAKADRGNPDRANALLDQEILDRDGAALSERNIVFARATLVRVTFNRHSHVRVRAKPIGLTR